MHQDFRDSASAGLQQRRPLPDNRQQQQDNGTREFQPPSFGAQLGDGVGADATHCLTASMERSRLLGLLPHPLRRPSLWRAK